MTFEITPLQAALLADFHAGEVAAELCRKDLSETARQSLTEQLELWRGLAEEFAKEASVGSA